MAYRFLLTYLCAVLSVSAFATPAFGQEIQSVGPIKTYTNWLPEEKFFKPSIKKKLPAGHRVDIPFIIIDGTVVIQRLTERTYWVMLGTHSITLFVGDEGALIFEAPVSVPTDKLLSSIRRVTDLPIRALVYNHPHVDHNGGAAPLRAALKKQGIELRIIASENCLEQIRRYKSLPEPTQTVPNGRAVFQFEKWTFKHVTPVRWAHTGADSYSITPDGVITFIDFVYPGALPFQNVSVVQNLTGFLEFIRHVAGEPGWTYANLGHSNVGYRKDVLRTLEYFEDLYKAWLKLIPPTLSKPYPGVQGKTNTAVSLRIFFDRSSEIVANAMKKKWGHVPQFEVARDHAQEVHKDMYLNYDGYHGRLPEFDPIPAPRP